MTATHFIVLLLLTATAYACGFHEPTQLTCIATPISEFWNGDQHPDCNYVHLPITNLTQVDYARDLYWLGYLREYALSKNPGAPFGGLVIDSRNNSIIGIRANTRNDPDDIWASIPLSHAELGLLVELQVTVLHDLVNSTTGRRTTNPNWPYMILYSTVSVCNMCQTASAWFGIKKLVYGARSTELLRKRCWGQATLSVQELADHSVPIVKGYDYVRGPYPEIEPLILSDFVNRC